MLQSTAPKHTAAAAAAAAVSVTDLPPHVFRAPDFTNLDLLEVLTEDVNPPNPDGWDWWWDCPRCHLTAGPYPAKVDAVNENDGHQCVLTPTPPNPARKGAAWTAADDDIICEYPVREAVLMTGRTDSQVVKRRQVMTQQGRTVAAATPARTAALVDGGRDQDEWTPEEDAFVTKYTPAKSVLLLTGRSVHAIRLRRKLLLGKVKKG